MEVSIDDVVRLYQSHPEYEPDIDEIISNTFYGLREVMNISSKIYEDSLNLNQERSKTYLNVSDFSQNNIDKNTLIKSINESDVASSSLLMSLEKSKRTQGNAIDLLGIMFSKIVKIINTKNIRNDFQQLSTTTLDNSEQLYSTQGSQVPNQTITSSLIYAQGNLSGASNNSQQPVDMAPIITTTNANTQQSVNNAVQLIQTSNSNREVVLYLSNDQSYCRYFPNCSFCKNNTLQSDDPTHYCLTTCTFCSSLRRQTNITKKTENIKLRIKDPQFANNDDIYFWVTLTSSLEDGPEDFLIESLIKNFIQMFPPSRSASAYVYSISNNNHNPILFGLIRYDRLNFPLGTRISTKSNHIKNNFKSFYTGKIVKEREYNIENLTTYKNKQYLTRTDIIREKYNFITINGNAIGSSFEKF